jgi:hypothetical protein
MFTFNSIGQEIAFLLYAHCASGAVWCNRGATPIEISQNSQNSQIKEPCIPIGGGIK